MNWVEISVMIFSNASRSCKACSARTRSANSCCIDVCRRALSSAMEANCAKRLVRSISFAVNGGADMPRVKPMTPTTSEPDLSGAPTSGPIGVRSKRCVRPGQLR